MLRLCLFLTVMILSGATFAQERIAADPSASGAMKRAEIVVATREGRIHRFDVEIAISPEEHIRGLMFRKSMLENHGMLFLSEREAPRAFWMKNTLIPLDMLFIRADGTIGHIHHRAVPHDLTPIPSRGPVLAVLELNGGIAEKLDITPGDIVRYEAFGNTVVK